MDTKTLPRLKAEQITPAQECIHSPILLFFCLLLLGGAIFFLDAVLPLRDLWFYNALLTLPWRTWLLLPTHLLFPQWPHVSVLAGIHRVKPASIAISWQEAQLLLLSIGLLFLCYLVAMRYLPRYVSQRFVMLSTLLLGLLYTSVPVVTSQDLFSYIAYARMLLLYHFNPLVMAPTAIRHDVIFPYLYWIKQPSIYGPFWVLLCAALQWGTLQTGFTHVASIVLLLRLFSLAMHLGSVMLVWSISGYMQSAMPYSPLSQQRRVQATLAFAWNPLLLFEACVNAHVDTTMLFFLLLAIWLLLPRLRYHALSTTLSAVVLAMASCIKITLIFFLPGLLLFLFLRYIRGWLHIYLALLAYGGTLLLFYVPFWDGGKILRVLDINPGAFHTINSPYAVLIYLLASLRGSPVLPATANTGSPIEQLAHLASMVLFVLGYGVLLLRAITKWRQDILLLAFVRWMARVWLLYCLLGSPWFWPWYMVTFLGLYALIEAATAERGLLTRLFNLPLAVRLLSFSMLSLYCFVSFAPAASRIADLKDFTWSDLTGAWIWGIPLLALFFKGNKGIMKYLNKVI